METKITRLRNLMTPVINYFAIQNELEVGGYPHGKYTELGQLMFKENIQARKNLREIRKILIEIPDNAINT